MRLETARLTLREFTDDDWQAVLEYQSDPRYLEFYEWEARTPEDARAFVRRFVEQQHERPRRRFQLAITLADGRVIGNCGIRWTDHADREAELGYELDPRYWGHGYMTEAAAAMIAFAFRDRGATKIGAWAVEENVRSLRVLERLGFTVERRVAAHWSFKGRTWTALVFGLSKDEWSSRRAM